MACISLPTAALVSGGLSAAGGVASAMIGSNAAQDAANEQLQAAQLAANNEMAMYGQSRKDLSPYRNAGASALTQLQDLTGTNKGGNPLTAALTAKFDPTMAQLSQTPGYKFALQQGQQATTNSYAAQGLGQSGAALKGAANYAEGLASTTYQQQFQNYWSQNQAIAGMLGSQVTTGANAAAMTAQQGLQAAQQENQLTTSGAAAAAGGTIGSANALTSGIGSVTGSLGNSALMYGLTGNGMFGSGSSSNAGELQAAREAGLAGGLSLGADGSIY